MQVRSPPPQAATAPTGRGYCQRCGQELGVNEKMRGLTVHEMCPTPAFGAPGERAATRPGSGQTWGSVICSLLALAFLPPLFGAIAIYLAIRVRRTNKDAGNGLLAMAIVCTLIGMVIGAVTWELLT